MISNTTSNSDAVKTLASAGFGIGSRVDARNWFTLIGDLSLATFCGFVAARTYASANDRAGYVIATLVSLLAAAAVFRFVWQIRSPELWVLERGLVLKFGNREEVIPWGDVRGVTFWIGFVTVTYVDAGSVRRVTRVRNRA